MNDITEQSVKSDQDAALSLDRQHLVQTQDTGYFPQEITLSISGQGVARKILQNKLARTILW